MGSPGPQDPEIARALAEGARRSRESQGPGGPAPVPAPRPSPVAPSFWEGPARAFLVRHKWKFLGLLFLLLTELCLLFLGKGLVMGPG
jgi:hypothetical protein